MNLLMRPVQAAKGVCLWVDGLPNCSAYKAAAVVNLVCGACDYSIVGFFALGGHVMEHSSIRLKRCAIPLIHAYVSGKCISLCIQ